MCVYVCACVYARISVTVAKRSLVFCNDNRQQQHQKASVVQSFRLFMNTDIKFLIVVPLRRKRGGADPVTERRCICACVRVCKLKFMSKWSNEIAECIRRIQNIISFPEK